MNRASASRARIAVAAGLLALGLLAAISQCAGGDASGHPAGRPANGSPAVAPAFRDGEGDALPPVTTAP
ncbi:hypothetical protein [Streptomyces sp. URMC 123]|uniref:hypothetical protein n=1 Tax=Streptomyces sp. URMC 123 TaxID=3423403 RepID=UPI003F19409A